MTGGPVRALVFHAADLGGSKIGGIQSFVRGFAQFAPDDFEVECVGTTSDPEARPIGRWTHVDVAGRSVRYLPVARTDPSERRGRVPVALSYTMALVRHRRRFATRGRVLNFHRAGVPLALIGRDAPRVQFVHLNVADIYGEQGESRWRRLPGAYHWIEDRTLRWMDRVWVVNEAGVRFYRERHPELADRFAFLPTWFDPGIFGSPSDAERDRIRREVRASLGLGEAARVVLFVGRLEAQKDPELLVRAFARAAAAGEDLHLVIVGSGGLGELVSRIAGETGVAARVHQRGALPRPDVARMMVAADVLALASRFEGMPITVIEAMATGLPVVATAVGEVPRLVTSGSTGWLVEERSAEAIADGLERVLALPVQPLRAAAIRTAGSYRADAVLGPVYDHQRELAARTGRSAGASSTIEYPDTR